MRNILGYHKFALTNRLIQFFRINRYRLKGVKIMAGVQITKGTKLYSNNTIGIETKLNENVILGSGVKIGNYALISNIQIGENSIIESRVICTGFGKGKIVIGSESYIGLSNILDWSDNIIIGDYVHIAGPSTGLWTHTSAPMCLNGIPLENKSQEYRPTTPILIESNVYIGGNCTIYPGITIGHHSITAPNSAVTENVEPYTMVGGVPAKVIKKLDVKR
jgi:acetyltransferase-like isoleucine patch superfamily enzyme